MIPTLKQNHSGLPAYYKTVTATATKPHGSILSDLATRPILGYPRTSNHPQDFAKV